jgi:signal transduction histidine kinase
VRAPSSLRARYLAGVGILLLFIVAGAIVTTVQLSSAQADNERLNQAIRLNSAIKRLDVAISAEEAAVYAPSASDPSLRQAFAIRDAAVSAAVDDLQSFISDPSYTDAVHLMLDTVVQWRTWATASNVAARAGATTTPPPPLGQGARLLENYHDASGRLESRVAAQTRTEDARARDHMNMTILLLVLFAITLGGALAGLSIIFLRSTLAPVRDLARRATSLARGEELELRDQRKRSDEVGELQDALTTWQAALRERLTIDQTLSELSSSADPAELASLGADLVRTLFDAALVTVSVAGPGGSRLLHRSGPQLDSSSIDADVDGTSGHSAGEGAVGTEAPVLSELSPLELDTAAPEHAAALDHGRCLWVPLRVGGLVVGAVTAIRPPGAPAFTVAEVERSESLVVALAAAIRSAQVIGELRSAKIKLEAADRQKNDFVASMSHELRTPLNSVLGFTQLLLMGTAGPMLDKQRRYVSNVEVSGRHLLALINDVLDLAKIEAGRLDVASEPISLGEIVSSAVAQIDAFASERSVQIKFAVNRPAIAIGDELRVKQVVFNLLSNAVKFTPSGGRVKASVSVDPDHARIEVSDTGVGIPADKLDAIFDRFTQIDSAGARPEQGTGLGLTLSRQLVELMGGRLVVASEMGKGSVFTVVLPRHPDEVQAARRVKAAAS